MGGGAVESGRFGEDDQSGGEEREKSVLVQ